jgi:hypothetical protein
MCERGCIFNAGFAGFCAGFRRGERGCVSGGVLTQGMQGSAQSFAGASCGVRVETR